MLQIRAVSLTDYLQVAASVGLDGDAMLRRVGLSREALRDPEGRVPAQAFVRLIETSALDSGREDFGLLMAGRRTFASLGAVAVLLERLPNLREIVRTSAAYQRHFNDIVQIELVEAPGVCLIRIDFTDGHIGPHTTDELIGVSARTLSGATGAAWQPEAVHLTRAKPHDDTPWRRFFGVPVEFASGFNGFSTSYETMLRPNPLSDPVMAANARRLLGFVPLTREPGAVSEQVRRTLALLLPESPSLGHVATSIGMSRRNMQRHLAQEGTGFGELLDELRREQAAALVARSRHPITTIAARLGYASPGAFSRWFATRFGMSPQQWRAQGGQEPSS